jgi:putative pyruvate formate lyase activating enzyme
MKNRKIKIAWYGKHYGEEPPLVGTSPCSSTPCSKNKSYGAGAIFFSGCNLHCVFCQNFQVSQEKLGKEYSIKEVTQIMLDLQDKGAANIDLVTPTPWWRQVKEAITPARQSGLNIPIVWNSNAYEKVHIIREMAGLIDIYLPDFKYADDTLAVKYSCAPGYSRVAEKAIREMYRQVGQLKIKNGIAQKGLIIRHLIIPGHINNSLVVMEKIADIDKNIYVSLMSQFYPVYHANRFPEINRSVTREEIESVEAKMAEVGLENGWLQEAESGEIFLPDFSQKNPFEK